jgi:signal transduction histidine kinase
VRDVREHVEREEGNYKAFVSGYSELAAVGQAVPGILGAIDPLLREVQREVDTLRKLLAGQKGAAVTRSLRNIADGCTGIEKRLQVLSPMQGNHSVRRRAIDVVETLKALVKHFAPLLEERDVSLAVEEPEGLARGEIRPENLYRVLHILITNSLDWLQGTNSPKITIAVSTTESECILLVSRQRARHPRGNALEGVRADVHGP